MMINLRCCRGNVEICDQCAEKCQFRFLLYSNEQGGRARNAERGDLSVLILVCLFFCPDVGVVSVSFEEDEEGNLCLIAYPLHSDPSDQENTEPSSDGEPKSKLLKWGKKKPSALLENERMRTGRKDDKSKR